MRGEGGGEEGRRGRGGEGRRGREGGAGEIDTIRCNVSQSFPPQVLSHTVRDKSWCKGLGAKKEMLILPTNKSCLVPRQKHYYNNANSLSHYKIHLVPRGTYGENRLIASYAMTGQSRMVLDVLEASCIHLVLGMVNNKVHVLLHSCSIPLYI